jgi:peptidoglycan hydrolase-like protein with peptidoglycan-binding domain
MWALPSDTYTYRPLKEGLNGYDVWVLQLNLNALGYNTGGADGYFGAKTKGAVTQFQSNGNLEADGIAGIRTQQSIALVSASPAQNKYKTPGGLLRGIMLGESGFILPAVSSVYSNGSRDIGVVQENLSATELALESEVADSFTALNANERTAARLRNAKDKYYSYKASLGHEKCWRYAVLSHNWPSAAHAYVYKDINKWTYIARYYPNLGGPDDGFTISYNSDGSQSRSYYMTSDAQWIYKASGGRLTTGFQWADNYVDSKVKFVTNWIA